MLTLSEGDSQTSQLVNIEDVDQGDIAEVRNIFSDALVGTVLMVDGEPVLTLEQASEPELPIVQPTSGSGDGLGNGLNAPQNIAVDGAGNVYMTALFSDNAFKISPSGVITEIFDVTGDGAGNAFEGANSAMGVSSSGIAYAGSQNSIAFKIAENRSLILKDGFESIP